MTHTDSVPDPWVVEATVDVPACIRPDRHGTLDRLTVCLGGAEREGFTEMRPVDPQRATASTFWSERHPIVYECRVLVSVQTAAGALLRGRELYEHLSDRLTLLTGYPVRVLGLGFAYNEQMLRRCISGELSEFEATTGGDEGFRTQVPKNSHLLQQLLIPPENAFEAIRWFRRAMTSRSPGDQYLYYYIAMESIAPHVPGVTRGPRRSNSGEEEAGLETQQNAAIKHLIARRGMPREAKRILTTIRARIAHGNADFDTLEAARANVPAVQRLAADGIAMVYGVDPDQFKILEPTPIQLLAPHLRSPYSAEADPSKSWGGLLSDAFVAYIAAARRGTGAPDSSVHADGNAGRDRHGAG